MSFSRALAFVLAMASAAACVPVPAPGPTPSVQDGGAEVSVPSDDSGTIPTACERARANVARLGCKETLSLCEKIEDARLIRGFDPICIANAPTKEAVRTCSGIVCE